MINRRILPQRRQTFTFDLNDAAGRPDMTVSYSTFEPPGASPPHTVAEIFIVSRKIGSDAEAVARDAAILLSLAVQHDCPFDVIVGAITRNADGSAQSLLGKAVDRVAREAGAPT